MGILDVNAGLTGSMTQSLNTISSVNRLANDSIARINSGLKFTHAGDAPVAMIKAQELQSDINLNNKSIDNNNYTIGQFDTILTAQDSIISSLNEMKSIREEYDAESDADAKSILAEKYKGYADGITAIVDGSMFKDSAVLKAGATETIASMGTNGSVSVVFDDLSLSGLGLTDNDIANGTAADISTAITTATTNNALISANKDIFEKTNDIMAASNTAWGQSYNDLVKVNDAEESALLTSLSNRASAASAAMSYQSKFYNLSSGMNVLA